MIHHRFLLFVTLIVLIASTAWLPAKDTPAADPRREHVLAVQSGSGGGSYKAKSKVIVTADAPPAGKYFDKWTAPETLKLRRPDHSCIALAMPDADVTLTANYADISASKRIRVACVGDSITEITGYPRHLAELLPADQYEVRNFGVSASTALFKSEKPYFKETSFRAAKDYKANVIVILLGTNDTRKANPNTYQHIADFVPDYKQIVTELAAVETRPKIILGLPTPMYGEGNWGLNEENLLASVIPGIKQVADELKLPIVDAHTPLLNHPECFKDRVHPSGDGPKLLAAVVYKAITGQEAPAPGSKTPVKIKTK